jgi:hypothetical protein
MQTPVTNWKQNFQEINLYYDLLDPEILHYGPSVAWSELIKQALGAQYTVIRGEVDFGYTPQRLQNLMNAFPGFRLIPLSAQDITNGVSIRFEIGSPHSLKLSLIQSLPFPRLSFNLTVSHGDAQYQALIGKVEQAWASKSLFKGGVRFLYATRTVTCAYTATLPRVEVESELRGLLVGNKWPQASLGQPIYDLVVKNTGRWLRSNTPNGIPNSYDNEVLQFLVEQILRNFFRQSDPIVVFDSGDKIDALEFVPSSTLVPIQSWTLNKSIDSTTEIYVLN